MLKRIGRAVRDHRTTLAYLILMAFVAFAITIAFVAIGRVQTESNKTRCQIVALVETFTQNSQQSAKATLASPSATKEQKDTAVANLARVRAGLETTRKKLGNPTGAACTLAS